MNHHRWITGIAALLFSAAALGQPVRVSSKNFTEQFVLAELYAQAFEAAGIKVERKINLVCTLIVHKALEEKHIDFIRTRARCHRGAEDGRDDRPRRRANKVKEEYARRGWRAQRSAG
jgi:osmoprotectant transport system substrate-binding protein